MNIWKKQRRERGEYDQDVAYRHGSHKHTERVCVACHNSRQCATCQGAGCQDCDYQGVCQECIDWAPKESDDE